MILNRLNLKSNSILDIYIELFLNEAEKLLHEGLVKTYKHVEGNQLAMKGQLRFQKNISKNLVHKERFFVRHTQYNRENVFNQIILNATQIIPEINRNPFFTDRAYRLLLDWPELENLKVTAATFDRLIFDRKTERYKEALVIGKMLLLNYRPDITGGNENVIAILFDMNKLWEEFVFRRLKKEELKFGIQIQRQQSESFWHSNVMFRPKTIRPDMVIRKGKETIIVDTKWKVLTDLIPSDEDLKQMYVYNLYWSCDKSVLLYPGNKEENHEGDYNDFRNKGMNWKKCTVQTISIFNAENGLDDELGKKILMTLLKYP